MSSSKSNRKNRYAELLKEIKGVRDEIKNLDARLSKKLESLRTIFKDGGIISLTIGGILMGFSLSFISLGLTNLFRKTVIAGFLIVFSSVFFYLQSLMHIKKARMEGLGPFLHAVKNYSFSIVGIAIWIIAIIILGIL